MTRFYGKIGFVATEETDPGIWEPVETEREYYGDVVRNQRRYKEHFQGPNDSINLTNEISVLADDYAISNYGNMRWVEFNGVKWKISWINLDYPRINLTLSEVYNDDALNAED